MPDYIVEQFWEKWESSIDKAEVVQKLSIINRPYYFSADYTHGEAIKHSFATILNSYFEDLYEFMIKKYNIEIKDE